MGPEEECLLFDGVSGSLENVFVSSIGGSLKQRSSIDIQFNIHSARMFIQVSEPRLD